MHRTAFSFSQKKLKWNLTGISRSPVLQINMTTNYSFYVPRVHNSSTEEQVRLQFRLNNIGVVRRVDFNQLADTNFMSAFVHMESMFDTSVAHTVIETVFHQAQPYRIHPDITNASIYWILLRNTRPVPETTLNIHQVVENHRILEQLVFQQQQQIEQLQATLIRLIGSNREQIIHTPIEITENM